MKKIVLLGVGIIVLIAASLYPFHLMAKSIANDAMVMSKALPYFDLLIIKIDRFIINYLPFVLIILGLLAVCLIKLYSITSKEMTNKVK